MPGSLVNRVSAGGAGGLGSATSSTMLTMLASTTSPASISGTLRFAVVPEGEVGLPDSASMYSTGTTSRYPVLGMVSIAEDSQSGPSSALLSCETRRVSA